MKFTPEEIAAIAKEAGITFWPMTVDGVVYDYRHVHCNDAKFKDEAGCIELLVALVAEKAAAKEREALLVEMRSGEVQLPMQVAARWPSVPGSHKYAGAGGCQPGSFGADSEDLFTTAQLLDYGDRRAAAEREACCGPDVTNSAGICAADMPGVVVQKYCAAIRARGRKEGVC